MPLYIHFTCLQITVCGHLDIIKVLQKHKIGQDQTCTAQRFIMSCFGELPDLWFCQKFLKHAKNHSKIVKIWPVLWKATSVSAEIHNFKFLAFLNNLWISALPDVAFHKNGQILTILLWFLAFLSNFIW